MQKWEYWKLDQHELKKETEKEIQEQYDDLWALNVLGQKGWELVDVKSRNSRDFYYFKKPQLDPKPQKKIPEFDHKMSRDEIIEAILIKEKIITQEEIKQIKEEHKDDNLPIEEILVKLGIISREIANQYLALCFDVPFFDLSAIMSDKNALDLVSEKTCKERQLIPISLNGNILSIAMTDPESISLDISSEIKALSELSGKEIEIKIFYAPWDDIRNLIEMSYPGCLYPDSLSGS